MFLKTFNLTDVSALCRNKEESLQQNVPCHFPDPLRRLQMTQLAARNIIYLNAILTGTI